MAKQKTIRELIHDAVRDGANSVEEVHKRIAALPLRIIEEAGILAESAKRVEQLQDRSIGAVYDVIRQINDEVERTAGQILKDLGRSGSSSSGSGKPAAKARSTTA